MLIELTSIEFQAYMDKRNRSILVKGLVNLDDELTLAEKTGKKDYGRVLVVIVTHVEIVPKWSWRKFRYVGMSVCSFSLPDTVWIEDSQVVICPEVPGVAVISEDYYKSEESLGGEADTALLPLYVVDKKGVLKHDFKVIAMNELRSNGSFPEFLVLEHRNHLGNTVLAHYTFAIPEKA